MELNKVYNEDCMDTMSRMSDNFVDLIVTSPPYNCGIDYDVYNDSDKSWNEYIDWSKTWLKEIKRILKSDGRICLNVLLEMGIEKNKKRVSPYAEFYHIFNQIGLNPYGSPVWTDSHRVKYTSWGSWMKASAPYIYCPYEMILIGYKDVWKKQNKGTSTITKEEFMMGCSGIWNLKTQTKQITKANFHVGLPDLCIKLLSYEGDIIYDPFMGGGTTALACVMNNRKYIGSEISEEYTNISNERINSYKENK